MKRGTTLLGKVIFSTSRSPFLSLIVVFTVPEIPVDENVVRQSNIKLDINSLTRFPPEFGGQIYTEVEWKHQLHCLVRLSFISLIFKVFLIANAQGLGWTESHAKVYLLRLL